MTESPTAAMQKIVFNFMQRCFIGAPPKITPAAETLSEMRDLLCSIDDLRPVEVHAWDGQRQAALYKLMSDFVVILQLQPQLQFPDESWRASTQERLLQPLMSVLGTAPDPSNYLSPSPRSDAVR